MKRRFRLPFFILNFIVLSLGPWVLSPFLYAQDVTFQAQVDQSQVALGESVRLQLTFTGTSDAPAPTLPEIKGFQVRYVGPSSMMTVVNGRASSSISHTYMLVPLKTGTFTIAPLTVTYNGRQYTSQAISIKVVDSGTSTTAPSSGSTTGPQLSSDIKISDRVFAVLG